MVVNVKIEKHVVDCYAEGVYDSNAFTVKKGGKIDLEFAKHIRGGKTALKYRSDPEYVSPDGTILQDCIFKSPSTAAQFVTGRSTNGYETWKVEPKKSLGEYLREKGLR